jgi:hypothetical protein
MICNKFILKKEVFRIMESRTNISGARGSVVVKALCYKPEDRGFDKR